MRSSRLVRVLGLGVALAGLLGCSENRTNKATTTSPKPSDAEQPSGPLLIRAGSFVDGEHPTAGAAQIVKQNNQYSLELDQAFATSTSGPDLVVVLHRSADVIGSTTPPAFPINEGDYVLLAPLQGYQGAQSYPIPADLNLNEFKSVAIWCRRFNATFGAASLK